ncbi:MAG: alpha/beta fold hydrolase [Candidatus Berkelbacteria bacterium]|nr:MAG: alpha/beta fold hydrolase [Candidatus Berkelbacteria bacterium]QQG51951.1 MAG: alpha/beta fold hydrolase [Candidatus Berkelbacteria bacterium]
MKASIINRHEQKITVLVELAQPQKGLAFVMHGLGGFKEQPHIQVLAEELLRHGYSTVRFDATNSFGESDGNYEDATVTNYKEDYDDVITWAATQDWYQQPFILAGHSLGGMCSILYAEDHPENVLALAPMAPLVSGQLSYDYLLKKDPESMKVWQGTGWQIQPSTSKPGVTKKLKWSHMADRLRYDVLPSANKITMPLLIIVGSNDESCPLEHQEILVGKLPGKKELHVINGMRHTPHEKKHLNEFRQVFSGWLGSLL